MLRSLGKWCIYGLLLLAPGSFLVLPMLWLVRQLTARMKAEG
jgi:Na+-transporting NADH:ubiquinone oxidoreductase subunit NqrD